jgi:hypothetical protein
VSLIADTLKSTHEVYYLVEVDFGGQYWRFSTKNIAIDNTHFFQGKIQKALSIGTSFDFRGMKYSIPSISVEVSNEDRLQDQEYYRKLDGARCRVYIWTPGLTWADIETDGLLFTGTFHKKSHTKQVYSFDMEDLSQSLFSTLPSEIIDVISWPIHRTVNDYGGGGAITGLPEPLVFGEFDKGIPLLNISTSPVKYMPMIGISPVTDNDYNTGVEACYDKGGVALSSLSYSMAMEADGRGNPCPVFSFTSDQLASEPISCSIRGLQDGTDLIEHPAAIIQYLLERYTGLQASEIDQGSIQTMKSILTLWRFAVYINTQASTIDVIERLLVQCQAAWIQRKGRVGVMTINLNGPSVAKINTDVDCFDKVTITPTPVDTISNNVTFAAFYNATTKKYEQALTYDKTTNETCKYSAQEYGGQPLQTVNFPDIQDASTGTKAANRYLDLKAYRHDTLITSMNIWTGFDLEEGDIALITCPEGSSSSGAGWIDERCILFERKFKGNVMEQTWWRIAV